MWKCSDATYDGLMLCCHVKNGHVPITRRPSLPAPHGLMVNKAFFLSPSSNAGRKVLFVYPFQIYTHQLYYSTYFIILCVFIYLLHVHQMKFGKTYFECILTLWQENQTKIKTISRVFQEEWLKDDVSRERRGVLEEYSYVGKKMHNTRILTNIESGRIYTLLSDGSSGKYGRKVFLYK